MFRGTGLQTTPVASLVPRRGVGVLPGESSLDDSSCSSENELLDMKPSKHDRRNDRCFGSKNDQSSLNDSSCSNENELLDMKPSKHGRRNNRCFGSKND